MEGQEEINKILELLGSDNQDDFELGNCLLETKEIILTDDQISSIRYNYKNKYDQFYKPRRSVNYKYRLIRGFSLELIKEVMNDLWK